MSIVTQLNISISSPILGSDTVDIAATVRFREGALGDETKVLLCWPGGSFSQRYWDIPVESYSFSEFMAARGHVVISIDPLGVGQSTRPESGDDVGVHAMATAAAEFTNEVRARIALGTLVDGLSSLRRARFVGVGHSMGSIIVTAQQALFKSYDALIVLGFAASFRDTSADGNTFDMAVPDLLNSRPAEHVKSACAATWDEEYVSLDRDFMRSAFHLADVPADLIAADDAMAVRWPRRPIVEAAAGFDVQFADHVDVPVFLGFGRVDLAPDARAEIQRYSSSSDISLLLLNNSAHMHNFSADRGVLWNRIDRWL